MPQLPDSFPIASHVVSLVDPMFEDLEESEVVEGNSVESEREILEEVGLGRFVGRWEWGKKRKQASRDWNGWWTFAAFIVVRTSYIDWRKWWDCKKSLKVSWSIYDLWIFLKLCLYDPSPSLSHLDLHVEQLQAKEAAGALWGDNSGDVAGDLEEAESRMCHNTRRYHKCPMNITQASRWSVSMASMCIEFISVQIYANLSMLCDREISTNLISN